MSSRTSDELGLDPQRLAIALEKFQRWTAHSKIPAISICVGRCSGISETFSFGARSDTLEADSIHQYSTFLVASLTKPLTALAMVLLVERGEATLDDLVGHYLPEFAQNDKERIRIRHLLTHTSGLPDMLPSNESLRTAHADQAEFLAAINATKPLFREGSEVRYSSMAFQVLAALVEVLSGRPLAEFLATEVFQPLGMTRTHLGAPIESLRDHAWIRLPASALETDWHWNSRYWLGFGAPWGGLITTASDYARFLLMLLRGGELDGQRILSAASVRAMTTCRLGDIPNLSADWIQAHPWGLGWRLRWPGRSSFFGDLLGPRMFGHWGSTGTLAWVDPDLDALAVILTTLPQDPQGDYLARASNLLAACF